MTGTDDLIAPDLVSRPILTGAWDLTEEDDEEPVIMDLPGALGLRYADDTYRLVYLASPWSSLMYAMGLATIRRIQTSTPRHTC
ncbi:MAG: hypothetical protein ACOX4C_02310 [Bacillota bacterium]